MDDDYYDDEEEDEEEDYEYEPSLKRRIYRVIGFLVIAGLIYITGVQQALHYQRTPLGTPQEEAESLLSADMITVPLQILVFQNDENFGSERNADDISQIVNNSSDIWNQADIEFEIKQIVFLDATDEEIAEFFDDPGSFVAELHEYNPEVINVFFSKVLLDLPGINGIAYTGINTVAVPDLTTVYDFRVLAHEIGHVLGLRHTDESRSLLMYRSANSFDITEEEALIAREEALEF